ncbi:1,4-alpha-glucan branching protein GlgB [Pseudohalioglobus lutimaris]
MRKLPAGPLETLDSGCMQSVVSGTHGDLFSVLGAHTNPSGKGLVIRTFLPGASGVEVISRQNGKKVTTLRQIHPDGLFEKTLLNRKNRFDYFLRVAYDSEQVDMEDVYRFSSCLSEDDLYLFGEGTQERSFQWMGAHPRQIDGVDGVLFVVWAPSSRRVAVVGDFNHWDGRRHVMRPHPASGIWELFIPDLPQGSNYKYEIINVQGEVLALKSDPYARSMQHPPQTASMVQRDNSHQWGDGEWMARRSEADSHRQPVSIYEVHLGSWRRRWEEDGRYLSYRELADELIPYVVEMGFTHLQLMPISEYPFDGSWGYQPIGMYAPSIRFGTPAEFKYFADQCHQAGIGLMLDWVPGHFPTDEHGLGRFDGSCLYEHEDERQGFHPDWNTLIYNYGRGEVVSYLLSNAMYWIEEYHLDGLRVDAVASMLYLDYSREEGQWVPNEHGGRENLEAIELLRTVNSRLYFNHPGIMMTAEESTDWPGVSQSVDNGGLGFGYKWNMGWMNDTLSYMERDPIHRQYHHNEMTFGIAYAWSENFVLPLSHDEVVHGKRSLLHKMPGDEWQQFANLRAYLGFMWGHPGKKLLFMGGEFAQRSEWDHDGELEWHLLEYGPHRGMQSLVRDLNQMYISVPALYEQDCDGAGFEWVQVDNRQTSVFAWLRRGANGSSIALVVSNLTPTVHLDYRVGVPVPGYWAERLNTDAEGYGGSNVGNFGGRHALAESCDGQSCCLQVSLPPLATLIFELQNH